jgi:hypothetical protein
MFDANNCDIKSVHPKVVQDGGCTGVLQVAATNFSKAEEKEALQPMATYRDPVRLFAPLEVIERLLEIRAEAGFSPAVYLLTPENLAACLDAYGFDVFALEEVESEFHFGNYRAPLAPGGSHAHNSVTAH